MVGEPLTDEAVLDRYDAGLLSDGGGGNVDWWWDYLRAELDRAHHFYDDQWQALLARATAAEARAEAAERAAQDRDADAARYALEAAQAEDGLARAVAAAREEGLREGLLRMRGKCEVAFIKGFDGGYLYGADRLPEPGYWHDLAQERFRNEFPELASEDTWRVVIAARRSPEEASRGD